MDIKTFPIQNIAADHKRIEQAARIAGKSMKEFVNHAVFKEVERIERKEAQKQ